jgi:hypothetical protein
MLIDCDTCQARGPACGDCVVTVLLGAPPVPVAAPPDPTVLDPTVLDPTVLDPTVLDPTVLDPTVLDPTVLDLDRAEQAAIAVLAGSGLVPPLRLLQAAEVDGAPPAVADVGAGRRCRGHGAGGRAAEAG